MAYTTHKKAPGTCDSKGLATNPIDITFPTTECEGKVFASPTALFVLAGFHFFANLEIETRPTVSTAAAVYYLNLQPKTSCICGCFYFFTAEIKRLPGVSA